MRILGTLAILATTALPAFAIAANDIAAIGTVAAQQSAPVETAKADPDERRDRDNPTPWLTAMTDPDERRDRDNPTPWLTAMTDPDERRDRDNPTPWLIG